MQLLLKIAGIFTLLLFQSCGTDYTQSKSKDQPIGEQPIGCKAGELALKVLEGNEKHLLCAATVEQATQLIKEPKNNIKYIDIANKLASASDLDIKNFFAAVRALPHLETFVTRLLGGMDDVRLYDELSKLKGLKKVTGVLDDNVIIALSTNNPNLEQIGFGGGIESMRRGLSEKGAQALSRLKELQLIYFFNDKKTAPSLLNIINEGSQFKSLKTIAIQHPSTEVFAALKEKLTDFPKLETIQIRGPKEKDLIAFLSDAKESLGKKPLILDIAPYRAFKLGTQERADVLKALAKLKLKGLKFTRWDFELSDLEQLKKLKNIEELTMQVPDVPDFAFFQELLSALPKLKKLMINKRPGGSINSWHYPAKFLSSEVLDSLKKKFPQVIFEAERAPA